MQGSNQSHAQKEAISLPHYDAQHQELGGWGWSGNTAVVVTMVRLWCECPSTCTQLPRVDLHIHVELEKGEGGQAAIAPKIQMLMIFMTYVLRSQEERGGALGAGASFKLVVVSAGCGFSQCPPPWICLCSSQGSWFFLEPPTSSGFLGQDTPTPRLAAHFVTTFQFQSQCHLHVDGRMRHECTVVTNIGLRFPHLSMIGLLVFIIPDSSEEEEKISWWWERNKTLLCPSVYPCWTL